VGAGDPDPHQGKIEDGYIYGRGSCDQRAGMASMVYAGKLIHELGMYDDFTLWMVGSVQKEDCDGLAWLHILKEDGIRPDCVLITEPTNLRIHRGQRGRMEVEVRLRGKSCDSGLPERGDNPIAKMAHLLHEVEQLNQRLKHDAFLGKGSIAVTGIRSESPSQCTVPGACAIHLDRRLTAGESRESALAEIRALPGAENAEVSICHYGRPSYTGLRYSADKYFPAWTLAEKHPLTQAAIATYEALFELPPVVGKWSGSTNGVGTMGLGVPTIGFGPGEEESAHTGNERVAIRHLVKAAQFYASFPLTYVETTRRRS
jgi:putative selenium metabolism hydrolase